MSVILSNEFEKFIDLIPEEHQHLLKRVNKATKVLMVDAEPEIGPTPKEVIWTRNKTKLYRYISDQPNKHKIPLLLVYALINKPYLMDLTKGSSLVEYLVNRGFDVYLLDWGTPGYEDKNMKLDDYIMDYIPRAVRKIMRKSNAKEVSVLGYCMGGTITSIFAALHPELPIRNLVFMTTPFDFEETGLYGEMLDERYFDIDKVVQTLGIIPPEMIDMGNKLLKPMANIYGPYVSLLDRAEDEKFVKSFKLLQKWLNDGIPFPGEAYRQWIRDFYQKNKLIKGELVIRGRQVNLKAITANVLNLSGEIDIIAQPHQVEALMDHISSKDKQYIKLPVGHTSISFGSKASKITYPTIGDWLEERSN
ncbi:class III poly(R)-hydroxyalkanoic acid synthase subunit PhaC [Neobacillus massiliamazoniensis]|uniref:Poly(3-hydroxyalkanoate) polymerase subunit PhaC n=1 Tax=Neobacillus massiliamazoniensis TaxID=1499688 RepID=A0A0U1NY83_9BACI|nr:class III poly(R)-hydroxyalkanoic acid synthase subunit PhaC [Neobacillus massiliamazoniensis]CRK82981.1 poly(R)-hydroxyalkanoic acid synthase, class III, PhaC subunit [Neobacillus massiliamazoniensis]